MSANDQPATDADASQLTVAISQTIAALFSTGNAEETLAEVMAMAVADIEGCDVAALLLMDEDGVVTVPARTDRVVDDVEWIRGPVRGGVLLAALASQATFYVADLTDGAQADLAVAFAGTGVRGLLMLPLVTDAKRGGLVLLARYPHAFGVVDRARGLLVAYLAGVALTGTDTAGDGDRLAANLRSALAIREVIGQAQGVLMEREHISADQAFTLLRRASADLDVKMREVAQSLVDSGKWPDPRHGQRGGDR